MYQNMMNKYWNIMAINIIQNMTDIEQKPYTSTLLSTIHGKVINSHRMEIDCI